MNKLLLGAAALLVSVPAAAQTVYSNTFDSPATVAGGVIATLSGVTTTVGGGTVGLSGNFLRNDSLLNGATATPTVLTLSNLGAHTSVDINMIFGFMESWDSSNGSPAPDLVDIVVDGITRISGLTAANASGSVFNYGGGTLVGGSPCIQADTSSTFYCDTIIDLGTSPNLTFAHTGSTLTLQIFAYGAGWQGGTDEAWGIDNLSVTLINATQPGGVPEPATWAMMILGMGGIGYSLRRRRATVALA